MSALLQALADEVGRASKDAQHSSCMADKTSFEALASAPALWITACELPENRSAAVHCKSFVSSQELTTKKQSRNGTAAGITWGCPSQGLSHGDQRSLTLWSHLFVRARSTSWSRAWSFEEPGARRSGQGRPAGPPRSGLAFSAIERAVWLAQRDKSGS